MRSRDSTAERILRAQLEEGGDAYLRAPTPPAAFRDKFKIVPVTTETKEVSLKKSVDGQGGNERRVAPCCAWRGFITDMSAFPKAKELTLLWSARTREGGYELRANEFKVSFFLRASAFRLRPSQRL